METKEKCVMLGICDGREPHVMEGVYVYRGCEKRKKWQSVLCVVKKKKEEEEGKKEKGKKKRGKEKVKEKEKMFMKSWAHAGARAGARREGEEIEKKRKIVF